jgi:hypothetical protein
MIGPPPLVDYRADLLRSVIAWLQLARWTPTHDPDSSRDLADDDNGLVVVRVARTEDESDRAPTRSFGESVERLRSIRVDELCAVARLELPPTLGVVSEPFAELRARAEVLRPGIKPELLLRPPARPEAVDQDPVAVVRSRIVVSPLQSDVAGL